jgi:hypothetical protein
MRRIVTLVHDGLAAVAVWLDLAAPSAVAGDVARRISAPGYPNVADPFENVNLWRRRSAPPQRQKRLVVKFIEGGPNRPVVLDNVYPTSGTAPDQRSLGATGSSSSRTSSSALLKVCGSSSPTRCTTPCRPGGSFSPRSGSHTRTTNVFALDRVRRAGVTDRIVPAAG